MKYSKYNIALMGAGLISLVAVIWRYFFQYRDFDMLLYYSLGSIAFTLCFYILDVVQRFKKQFDSLEDNLQARFERKWKSRSLIISNIQVLPNRIGARGDEIWLGCLGILGSYVTYSYICNLEVDNHKRSLKWKQKQIKIKQQKRYSNERKHYANRWRTN